MLILITSYIIGSYMGFFLAILLFAAGENSRNEEKEQEWENNLINGNK